MNLQDLIKGALSFAGRTLAALGEESRSEVHDEHTVDVSTHADRELSASLIRYFKQTGVPAVVESEESGRVVLHGEPRYTVAIDDLDGTDNFIRGRGILPCCTVVGVLEAAVPRFRDIVAAGILEHTTGTVWYAERSHGCSTSDGRAVHCAGTTTVNRRTLVVIDHYGSRGSVGRLSQLHEAAWIKDFGASGFHLAGVAAGRFDAFVNAGQKGHELAAGYLLVREAGGYVCDFDGRELEDREYVFGATYDIVAACTGWLARAILPMIAP